MSNSLCIAPLRALALAVVAAFALPAAAQQAGIYSGLTSQGLPIEIKLEDDGLGGLKYTLNGTQFSMTCGQGGTKTQYWFVGADVPLVDGAASFEFRSDFLYEKLNFSSNAAGTKLKGTFNATMPLFVDVHSSTKQITRCESGKVTFTTNQFTPPAEAAGQRLAPGRAMPAH